VLAALTIGASGSSQVGIEVSVPVQSVSVIAVVMPDGAWEYDNHHLMTLKNGADVTPQQLALAVERIRSAGFTESAVRSWLQPVAVEAYPRTGETLKTGMILVNLGAPSQARDGAQRLQKLQTPHLFFASSPFVRIDCGELNRRIASSASDAARQQAQEVAQASGGRAGKLEVRDAHAVTNPFDAVPLCSDTQSIDLWGAGRYVPVFDSADLTQRISATVEFTITNSATSPVTEKPPGAQSVFPYGSYVFPGGGPQDPAQYFPGTHRYVAAPGAAQIMAVPDAIVFRIPGAAPVLSGVAPADMYTGKDAKGAAYALVRLSHPSAAAWGRLRAAIGNSGVQEYHLVSDCAPYRSYARRVALERSRQTADAIARVLATRAAADAAVQIDAGGPSTDAICGVDASQPLEKIAQTISATTAQISDSATATFWDSLYASWQIGGAALTRSDPPQDYIGTASITPDAYIIEGWYPKGSQQWNTRVVAANGLTRKQVDAASLAHGDDRGAMNVSTQCDAAVVRAAVNAVKLARFDGAQIGSLYVHPQNLRSVVCYPEWTIGMTSSQMVLYAQSSPDDDAQVQVTITNYGGAAAKP
jgi:hypothetical protein